MRLTDRGAIGAWIKNVEPGEQGARSTTEKEDVSAGVDDRMADLEL